MDLAVAVSRYPAPGEDVEVLSVQKFGGGSAANFAAAISRLGLTSGLIAKVGSDEDGLFLYEEMKRERVDVSHVPVEGRTGTVIVILDNGRRTMLSYRDGATMLRPEEISREYISGAKLLHVSGYALTRSPQRESAVRAFEYAVDANLQVSLDPSPHASLIDSEIISRVLGSARVVFPDIDEAKILTGESEPSKAAEKILQKGPEIVALKLGSNGCLVLTKDEEFQIPAMQSEVVDTTGAGDAFDAAFVVGMLKGMDVKTAAEFANATAALKIMRRGARTGLPTLGQVEEFLRKQQERGIRY